MPTFDTPGPISVTVEVGVGDIGIVTGDRADTTVEVRPTDRAKQADVTHAEQTRVEYAGGRLLVKAPRGWRQYTFRGGGESVDVRIEMPAGSHLRGEAAVAALRCTGRLGECRFKTAVGEIQLDQAGPVELRTGGGDVSVERAAGDAAITTGSGTVRIGEIDGTAVVKNSNGDTWIGEVTGDLRVNAANGKITVDRALGAVEARTANGDVRLGEVVRGAVLARTAFGRVDVGVRAGVAAWLDLDTHGGSVYNGLDAAEGPDPGAEVVEVRARTGFGDIAVRRCQPESPSGPGGVVA
jgi:Putative adhesin